MAVAAIAEDVDDHVLLEAGAELGGDARDVHDRLGIVAVHVEDRRLHHLAGIGGIGTRARVGGVGGEADLVVDDEVDGAAGAVALELGQHQGFGDQTLAGKRRVAVHEETHHLVAAGVAALALLGAHLAEHDGIDRLQMRRIRRQRHVHDVAVELAVGGGAEVILHVAGALHVLGIGGMALELREQRRVGLQHHVGEHVEAPAMRHADDKLLHAELAAALQHLLQRRDQGLAAVEAEALGAGIALVEEALEHLGDGEALQDRALALRA